MHGYSKWFRSSWASFYSQATSPNPLSYLFWNKMQVSCFFVDHLCSSWLVIGLKQIIERHVSDFWIASCFRKCVKKSWEKQIPPVWVDLRVRLLSNSEICTQIPKKRKTNYIGGIHEWISIGFLLREACEKSGKGEMNTSSLRVGRILDYPMMEKGMIYFNIFIMIWGSPILKKMSQNSPGLFVIYDY